MVKLGRHRFYAHAADSYQQHYRCQNAVKPSPKSP
ncbi:MAG: hypothetical protein RL748_1492 [Pseudomonadota bacterium]|jgi:hypothetical protein